MGNWFTWFTWTEPPPPPPPPPQVVLVPPLFDFPPLKTRSRMAESSYDFLFSKVSRACLFGDYFEESGQIITRIILRPPDDPRADFTAILRAPFSKNAGKHVEADAIFRWQRNSQNPHNFVDLKVSNRDTAVWLRSCSFFQDYGVGSFAILPLLKKNRTNLEDYGILGVRYGSKHLSIGTTFTPIPSTEFPASMWMVTRIGQITSGFQCRPVVVGKDSICNVRNWSFAIDYGVGKRGPLNPSFNFSMEYCNRKELITSFYQHLVVQRRVRNPFEEDSVVGITNYIDLGFEFHARISGEESGTTEGESSIQVAGSWQANKNFLLKAKLSSINSAIALTFKSWWEPSIAFSIAFVREHFTGSTKCGFGIHIDNLKEASYERADSNYVMLIPTKEHIAEGILRNRDKHSMLEMDSNSGNFKALPNSLHPVDDVI